MPRFKHIKNEIEIDENQLVEAPTFMQKVKNTTYAMFLGVLLIQIILITFLGSTPFMSIILYYNNIYFVIFILVSGLFGWIFGERFIIWLKDEMNHWKIW